MEISFFLRGRKGRDARRRNQVVMVRPSLVCLHFCKYIIPKRWARFNMSGCFLVRSSLLKYLEECAKKPQLSQRSEMLDEFSGWHEHFCFSWYGRTDRMNITSDYRW